MITPWISPPSFDDDRLDYVARIVHVSLASVVALAITTWSLQSFILPANIARSTVLNLAGLVMAAGLLYADRRHPRATGTALLVLFWLLATGAALTAGGVISPVIVAYIILVSIGTLAFSIRVGAAILLASVAAVQSLGWMEVYGALPAPLVSHTPVSRATVWCTYLGVMFAIIAVASNATRGYLNRRRVAESSLKQAITLLDKSLQKQNARFEQLEFVHHSTGLVSWAWDIANGEIEWLGDRNGIIGFPDDGSPWTFEDYRSRLHPDDLPTANERLRDGLKGKRPAYRAQERVIFPDGTTRWLEAAGRFEYGPDGRAVRMAGTLRDITEQHLADEARAASERRYRELFDSAPDGIAIMSANGIVLDANPACCSETGCSRAEIVGRDFADFLAPESNPPKSLQLEFLEHQRSIVTNRNIQRSDGTRIPVELKKWPLPDGTIQMNLRDTSEREQVEELFTKVFDVGPGAMAITRMADATYLAVNNAWQTLTGWTAEEAIGRTSADLGIWLDFSDRARLVARLDRDTTLRGFETRIRHKSGEIREVIVGADTLEMAGFRYMLNSGFDITARKHAEAEIHKINATLDARVRDRTAELQEANRDLESFSYSISHDLQAHVRRIIGFSQTLEQNFSPDLPDGVNRLISKIDSNARRMGQFVTDLLAFSRVGKQHLAHFRVVDMQAEVEHLIEDLGVEGKVLLSNRLPGVSGDPSMLRQVWQNLILNAVKFTRSVDKPRIQISGQLLADGRAQYCVEDNGVGFDMAYADKLFGVFQRLHSEREFEGTGVGLAIVQRIITRHGGEVSAQGAVGKGAKFTFTLPENPKFAARSARDRAAPPTPEAP